MYRNSTLLLMHKLTMPSTSQVRVIFLDDLNKNMDSSFPFKMEDLKKLTRGLGVFLFF